jgi:NADH-quinone oxidoreductase subunit F
MAIAKTHVMLCFGTGCLSAGAAEVKTAFIEELRRCRLTDDVSLVETGCNGFCAGGPILVLYPGGYFYCKVTPADVPEVISEHILKGRPVERLMFRNPATEQAIPLYKDIPFFARQNLRVLHNKGRIAAESLDEYIGRDGYVGLARALLEMTPEQIVDEIKRAGLRGRGGAGFPTGVKWDLCRKAKGDKKYILCNADEGDPGAFMDRSLLEADPHVVLEGMMIGARAIGADTGYIYCRAEYPLALERLNHSIAECRARGLLGRNILGTDFSFDVFIAQGSGAFVCGEETALMRSIEGRRGEPRPRPPFPAYQGLWGLPSVLNNVETYGNVPLIVRHGVDWYRSVGTEKSPGTKIFALTGKVRNVGLVEVNMGIPLGDIIFDIGGGIPDGKKYKAAQLGGPSGGCIPKEHLNVPVDFESVIELGAIMGSGGLIVMDEDTCMVDMARFFLDFIQDESCGKCTPCRVGTKRMLEIVTRICQGQGEEGDIERLIHLGNRIKDTALCGLGQTAPNPVLSTIRYFRDEFEAHIRHKKCPAGVCQDLFRAPCSNACPAGVHVPGYISLLGEERFDDALRLHRERNPFASVCARVCFHPCESKCRRSALDAPLSVRGLKRVMADRETDFVLPEARENSSNAARKIAIVGGGPAGLSCAYFLARLGYRPTVYESEPQAGGMLRQGIPAYRLPRSILDREIRMIGEMGVDIRCGQALGKDFTLEGLRKAGVEAVFLGVGAPDGARLGIPGEDLGGVMEGIRFLRDFNRGLPVSVGKRVAVIGGGNAAIDAARTALRLGAESVQVLYRRTREEMPAFEEEIEEAETEGVWVRVLTAPLEIVGESGRVSGVKCEAMSLGAFDPSGRRRPVKSGQPAFVVEVDTVIAAIGQTLDAAPLTNGTAVSLTKNKYVAAAFETGQTNLPWLFTGGDAMTGPSSVTEAIGAGERAAVGIHRYLQGAGEVFWRSHVEVDTRFDSDADPVMTPRAPSILIDIEARRGNFNEVELGIPPMAALDEARRCLRCDYREKTAKEA